MDTDKPINWRFSSRYLLPALETSRLTFHQATLVQGSGEDEGLILLLDPNNCMLDEFGDPGGCTLMAIFRYPVELEHVREDDTYVLYDVVSDQELPAHFRVVRMTDPSGGECPVRLLTLGDDGVITQIAHLHAMEPLEQG